MQNITNTMKYPHLVLRGVCTLVSHDSITLDAKFHGPITKSKNDTMLISRFLLRNDNRSVAMAQVVAETII